jgi:hypothetical protein
MYLRCPTLIQKQVSRNILLIAVDITFLALMFQIFTPIPLLKVKSFEPLYLCEILSYTSKIK